MNGNYLNIKHKKCKFLYDEQSALRADSKRGYRWPGPRPHMNGNYLNIKHKKCKFLYDRGSRADAASAHPAGRLPPTWYVSPATDTTAQSQAHPYSDPLPFLLEIKKEM